MAILDQASTPWRAVDANGHPSAAALMYVYVNNTTTPVDTYSDSDMTTANAHPIVADGGGFFGLVYVADGAAYRVDITDANGDSLPGYPRDDVSLIAATDAQITAAIAATQTAQVGSETAQAAAEVARAAAEEAAQHAADADYVQPVVYTTIASLKASTEAARGTGEVWEVIGDNGRWTFKEVASGGDLSTASSVQLDVVVSAGWNVKTFGAIGDGVTDDTSAIQAAFDFVNGFNGTLERKTVVFPKGKYLISGTITSNTDGLIVMAYDAEFLPSGDITMFNLNTDVDQAALSSVTPSDFKSNIRWFGGFFNEGSDGKSSTATCVAIEAGNIRFARFVDIHTRHIKTAIRFCGTGTIEIHGGNFRNFQKAIEHYAAGDALLFAQDVIVSACNASIAAEDPVPTVHPYFIYIDAGCADWVVEENTVAMNHGGMIRFPTGSSRESETQETAGMRVINNFTEQSNDANPWVFCEADHGFANNIQIIGNTFSGGTNKEIIRIERPGVTGGVASDEPGNLTIDGNLFNNRSATAIAITSPSDGCRAKISDNTFRQRGSDSGTLFNISSALFANFNNNAYCEEDVNIGLIASGNWSFDLTNERYRLGSATTLTVLPDKGFLEITGSNTVQTITASWRGHKMTVTTSSSATLEDGTGNLELAGSADFVGDGTKVIELICDGTNWREISRSA